MARIGIDLDGVVYKFVDTLRNYIHETRGKPLYKMPPATRWEFYEDWGFTLQEYLQIMHDGAKDGYIFWIGDTYEQCKDVVNYLYHDRGDEIVFITSRHFKDAPALAWTATYHWLNLQANLPYHELIMSDDKSNHDLDVLFDDAPYQYEKSGDICVIFDQLWNKHVTEAPRVYGWDGILQYVMEKFPIAESSANVIS